MLLVGNVTYLCSRYGTSRVYRRRSEGNQIAAPRDAEGRGRARGRGTKSVKPLSHPAHGTARSVGHGQSKRAAVWRRVAGGPPRTYPPHRPFPTANSAIRFGAAAARSGAEPPSQPPAVARASGPDRPTERESGNAKASGDCGKEGKNPPRETRVAPPASSSSSSSSSLPRPPRFGFCCAALARGLGGARERRKP